MPLTTSGYLHMGKTKPIAKPAADGVFQVTLRVMDRQGTHAIEPWLVTYSGPDAQAWWEREGHTLQAGDTLDLRLTHMRVHTIGEGRMARGEAHARVAQASVIARAGANGRQNNQASQQHADA